MLEQYVFGRCRMCPREDVDEEQQKRERRLGLDHVDAETGERGEPWQQDVVLEGAVHPKAVEPVSDRHLERRIIGHEALGRPHEESEVDGVLRSAKGMRGHEQ